MSGPEHSIGLSQVANVLLGWFLLQWDETAEPDRDQALAVLQEELRLALDPRVVAGLVAAAERYEEWTQLAEPPVTTVLGPTVAESALPHRTPGCNWSWGGTPCRLPAGHDGNCTWHREASS